MKFNPQSEFELVKKVLLEIIQSEDYYNQLSEWVLNKNKEGYTKEEIYKILSELCRDVQTRPDPNDKLYDRIADFSDMFTTWAKGNRILPDEPDVHY